MTAFPTKFSDLLKYPPPKLPANESEEEQKRYALELKCFNLKQTVLAIQEKPLQDFAREQAGVDAAWKKYMKTPVYKRLLDEKLQKAWGRSKNPSFE